MAKYVCFLTFPTYVSSSFGSNRNIYLSPLEASGDFDSRRWGFRHLYILHSLKHMLTNATGRSKAVLDVPNVILKMPQSPPMYKRGACQMYILAAQNIHFGSFDPTFSHCCQSSGYYCGWLLLTDFYSLTTILIAEWNMKKRMAYAMKYHIESKATEPPPRYQVPLCLDPCPQVRCTLHCFSYPA